MSSFDIVFNLVIKLPMMCWLTPEHRSRHVPMEGLHRFISLNNLTHCSQYIYRNVFKLIIIYVS